MKMTLSGKADVTTLSVLSEELTSNRIHTCQLYEGALLAANFQCVFHNELVKNVFTLQSYTNLLVATQIYFWGEINVYKNLFVNPSIS